VDEAGNGAIALDKVQSENYDLVLMDVHMPVMDGYTATKSIREWEKRNRRVPLPILALTANVLTASQQKSLEGGCTAHLTKPIDRLTLLDAIELHVARAVARVAPADSEQPAPGDRGTEANRGGKIRIRPEPGMEEAVPRFLQNRHMDVRAMAAALERYDFEQIRTLGHNMKGSGTGYGFPEITDFGRLIEEASSACEASKVRMQIVALSQYLDRVEVIAA
jgi:CheY-like chemotaxis protein